MSESQNLRLVRQDIELELLADLKQRRAEFAVSTGDERVVARERLASSLWVFNSLILRGVVPSGTSQKKSSTQLKDTTPNSDQRTFQALPSPESLEKNVILWVSFNRSDRLAPREGTVRMSEKPNQGHLQREIEALLITDLKQRGNAFQSSTGNERVAAREEFASALKTFHAFLLDGVLPEKLRP